MVLLDSRNVSCGRVVFARFNKPQGYLAPRVLDVRVSVFSCQSIDVGVSCPGSGVSLRDSIRPPLDRSIDLFAGCPRNAKKAPSNMEPSDSAHRSGPEFPWIRLTGFRPVEFLSDPAGLTLSDPNGIGILRF